jgi:hydrogenase maturation protease
MSTATLTEKKAPAETRKLVEMSWDPITRIVGSLGIFTKIDFANREVAECYSTSAIFRGYSIFMKNKTWQEAIEREVTLDCLELAGLMSKPWRYQFTFPASRTIETVPNAAGQIEAVLERREESVSGLVQVSAVQVEAGLMKLSVIIKNHTALDRPSQIGRDECVLRSLASTHTILSVHGGAFVSSIDPPDQYRLHAALCRNEGTYPVLVGDVGETDTMLSSPITLYDFPRIAAESPGDFYDGTEIDEMLVLRIMTLTDGEKQAASAVDEHARALLARTTTLDHEQMRALHGKLRGMCLVPAENRDE